MASELLSNVNDAMVSVSRFNEGKEASRRVERNEKQHDNEQKRRLLRFVIDDEILEIKKLRKLCWRGIPTDMRPTIWKLLLGYLPLLSHRRETRLSSKRLEYEQLISEYERVVLGEQDNKTLKKIRKDVPRTCPTLGLFQIPCIAQLLTRCLFTWSVSHTQCGYVQGINDVITPFIYIFLEDALRRSFEVDLSDARSRDLIPNLSVQTLFEVETDSYFCLSLFLQNEQRNYVRSQPGIQEMLSLFFDVIRRANNRLFRHFEKEELSLHQFAFRWMNCVLMREFSLMHIVRLWDTYLAESVKPPGMFSFSEFHVFVCAALLLQFADDLLEMSFEDMLLFLQSLPTGEWKEEQLEELLSQACVFKQMFGKRKHSNATQVRSQSSSSSSRSPYV